MKINSDQAFDLLQETRSMKYGNRPGTDAERFALALFLIGAETVYMLTDFHSEDGTRRGPLTIPDSSCALVCKTDVNVDGVPLPLYLINFMLRATSSRGCFDHYCVFSTLDTKFMYDAYLFWLMLEDAFPELKGTWTPEDV